MMGTDFNTIVEAHQESLKEECKTCMFSNVLVKFVTPADAGCTGK